MRIRVTENFPTDAQAKAFEGSLPKEAAPVLVPGLTGFAVKYWTIAQPRGTGGSI